MNLPFVCAHCGKPGEKYSGHVNRSNRIGAAIYCDRVCAGLGRRKHITDAEKKAKKSAYDVVYQEVNREKRKAQSHEWHLRTYNPVKAAEERKKKMPAHVEYCRRPEYRAWKRTYDRKYRTQKDYGDFAECALLLIEIEDALNENRTLPQKAAEHYAEGRTNKSQNRKRENERLNRNEP